ncbi:hypothetical protein PoB_001381300 [Plakobranchus ocellatus]|uniref:Uncharacterized protein n=1 Tax=Plakobranchus ocellatus TaxID=259542 RepID=A0AAV3YYH2_9GAST|nr:hypothetical protein PoB_001381300 [Plakobranchus ocellatus]
MKIRTDKYDKDTNRRQGSLIQTYKLIKTISIVLTTQDRIVSAQGLLRLIQARLMRSTQLVAVPYSSAYPKYVSTIDLTWTLMRKMFLGNLLVMGSNLPESLSYPRGLQVSAGNQRANETNQPPPPPSALAVFRLSIGGSLHSHTRWLLTIGNIRQTTSIVQGIPNQVGTTDRSSRLPDRGRQTDQTRGCCCCSRVSSENKHTVSAITAAMNSRI